MRIDDFSIRVVGGHEVYGGYVEMKHGQQFPLRLRNDRDVPCDAEISFQGKRVGSWRIEPRSSIEVEHPEDDYGKFTFWDVNSREGSIIGGVAGDFNNGLIQVTFKPGVKYTVAPRIGTEIHHHHYHDYWPWYPRPWPRPYPLIYSVGDSTSGINVASITYSNTAVDVNQSRTVSASASLPNVSEGVVGLSGESSQEYSQAKSIIYSGETVTISLRLVAVNESDFNRPRPIVGTSNPVPPPIK